MTPENVLSLPAKVLTQAQRESYFENGYLLLERFISQDWLDRLTAATQEMVERTREIETSDEVWDLEPGHSAEAPRLRRLSSPNDHHPTYWAFASQSPLVDAISDLVGPDVKFHHSKLNFKWAGGGEEVKWHQDIQFWPHTNYSPLTAGLYLQDCGMDQGPLGVISGSHDGPLYDQYDADGNWTGCLSAADTQSLEQDKVVYLPGPAGSITLHNCRTIHGSLANSSRQGRPLLLNVYSAADALPYTQNPLYSEYDQAIVRGTAARWAHHDPRPCLIPPNWQGGYKSIFSYQQNEAGEQPGGVPGGDHGGM